MFENNNGLSRRTVVKGAAWSVPVIAAAIAVPLAAASNVPVQRNVGDLVESSPDVTDTNTRLSAARVEACHTDGTFSAIFNLTATLAYSGSNPEFSLVGTTIESGVPGFWNIVSATKDLVTVRATGNVTCYVGLPALTYRYNAAGAFAEMNSLTAEITGESTDGTLRIGGLVSAIHGRVPVIGPDVADAPGGGAAVPGRRNN